MKPKANAYYYRVYCDGGEKRQRGYGGFVVQHAGKILERQKQDFGRVANNAEAEYKALLLALDWLSVNLPLPSTCYIYSDNLSMVNQLKGRAQVLNPQLRPLYQDAVFILKRLPGTRLTWVERHVIVYMLGY